MTDAEAKMRLNDIEEWALSETTGLECETIRHARQAIEDRANIVDAYLCVDEAHTPSSVLRASRHMRGEE